MLRYFLWLPNISLNKQTKTSFGPNNFPSPSAMTSKSLIPSWPQFPPHGLSPLWICLGLLLKSHFFGRPLPQRLSHKLRPWLSRFLVYTLSWMSSCNSQGCLTAPGWWGLKIGTPALLWTRDFLWCLKLMISQRNPLSLPANVLLHFPLSFSSSNV